MSNKRKLAIITPGFKPVPAIEGGAIEQLITDMLNGNESVYAYDIDLYTIYDHKLEEELFSHTNIIYVKRRWYDVFIRGINYIKRRIFKKSKHKFEYLSYMMSRAFKTNYYDIVLVENNMDTYISLLKKVKNEKLFFHLHNDFDCDDPAKTLSKTKKIINSANGILVVSNYLKEKLKSHNADNVTVVHNFVKNQEFSEAITSRERENEIKEKYHLKNDDIIVLYVGRLEKEKGVDKLLKSLLLLKNSKVKCLIVGDFLNKTKYGKYWDNIRKMLMKLQGRVFLTGYVQNRDLANFYSISNFTVIPSQWEEAFGLVALEAMKMKKAVIASDAGGLLEVLSPQGSINIKRDDNFVSNLASAINRLSENKKLCLQMGEANYKRSRIFPQSDKEYLYMIVRAIEYGSKSINNQN